MKAINFILFTLVSFLFLNACSSDNTRYIDTNGKEIAKIQITPAEYSVPEGYDGNYKATAYLNDGTTEDVTNKVIWHSSDSSIVSINVGIENPGYARAFHVGTTTIQASLTSDTQATIYSNKATIKVTAAVLESINLSPPISKVPLGLKVRYRAIGVFSDSSAHDITHLCSYKFTDSSVAQPAFLTSLDYIVDAIGVGNTKITASHDGITSNTVTLFVSQATLSELQISPGLLSIPKGLKKQFSAVAFYSDGTGYDVTKDVEWNSDDSAKMNIDTSGKATAKNLGFLHILAAYKGLTSNSADVTVTSATTTSIHLVPAYTVTLPKGRMKQYQVWAYLSDGKTKDVTSDAVLNIDDDTIATIQTGGSDAGLVQATNIGSTLVRAKFAGYEDTAPLEVTAATLSSIIVTPYDTNVSVGKIGNFIATGTYSDGTMTDITKEATWTSSDVSIVHVVTFGADGGFAEALAQGSAIINAYLNGIDSNNANVTVTGKTLNNVQIVPNNRSYIVGDTYQYSVHAIYDDLSVKDVTAFTFIKSNKVNVATFDNSNIMHAIGTENNAMTSVKCTTVYEGKTSETEILHVSPAPIDYTIEIIPNNICVVQKAKGQMRAIKHESDGTQSDITTIVTWSSNSTLIDVNATGYAESNGTAGGPATIKAELNGVTGTSSITVTDKTIKNVQISPNNISVLVDSNTTFKVYTIYDDNTMEDVTEFTNLQSSDTNIAEFTAYNILHAKSPGMVELTATYQGFTSEREFVHVNK